MRGCQRRKSHDPAAAGDDQRLASSPARLVRSGRDVDVLGQPKPALQQGHALGQAARPDVGLHIEVMDPCLHRQLQHRLHVVDSLGKRLPDEYEVFLTQQRDEPAHLRRIDARNTDAVVAGLGDAIEIGFERRLEPIGLSSLHRPQRLEHEHALRHGVTHPPPSDDRTIASTVA